MNHTYTVPSIDIEFTALHDFIERDLTTLSVMGTNDDPGTSVFLGEYTRVELLALAEWIKSLAS